LLIRLDDEKYLLERDVKKQAELMRRIKAKKPLDLIKHYNKMGQDNIRDIIACGFLPEKTFIFSDLDTLGYVLCSSSTPTVLTLALAVPSIEMSCLWRRPLHRVKSRTSLGLPIRKYAV